MSKDMPAPCKNCPFSPNTAPGYLGGSQPEVYIGQAFGPFRLPCHLHYRSDAPDWKEQTMEVSQCAGAAIFRANVGVTAYLPDELHKLPPSGDAFKSAIHFLAHHRGISLEEAQAALRDTPPHELLRRELSKTGVIVKVRK
jgi:hypothetical protein